MVDDTEYIIDQEAVKHLHYRPLIAVAAGILVKLIGNTTKHGRHRMKNDLETVNVGDWIWTIKFDWVMVLEVDHSEPYAIRTSCDSYTIDGKYDRSDKYPSAFTEPPECFNAPPKPRVFKRGDRVLVRDNSYTPWKRRYFSHQEKGKFYCFLGGDEWSSGGELVEWDECKPWAEGEDE